MIKDNISNYKCYKGLSGQIDEAFDIASKLPADIACGRYEVADGLYYNVMEYEGKSAEGALAETHDNYLDLQFILKGVEIVGYAPRNTLKEEVPYNAQKDIQQWSGEYTYITLHAGDFILVYAQDGHAPGIAGSADKIKKAVFKIKYKAQ